MKINDSVASKIGQKFISYNFSWSTQSFPTHLFDPLKVIPRTIAWEILTEMQNA